MAVFLAACKFLDILFVVAAEDFQLYGFEKEGYPAHSCRHQWIFLTDTISALTKVSDRLQSLAQMPTFALLDQLSIHLRSTVGSTQEENLAQKPVRKQSSVDSLVLPLDGPPIAYDDRKRRPYLTLDAPLQTIADAIPFLESISKWTMEGMLRTADRYYNPFPRVNDSQPFSSGDAKKNPYVLNEKTVDVGYIESLMEIDFVDTEDKGSSAAVRNSTTELNREDTLDLDDVSRLHDHNF